MSSSTQPTRTEVSPYVYTDMCKIRNDYLTPLEYPHEFCTSFYIELYNYGMNHREIEFITTLKADWINGSLSKDRSTEYMSSCDLQMCLSENNIFKLENNFSWENKILKIVKVYNFLNDKNKTYYRSSILSGANDGFIDKTTVWNICLGYYVVDSISYKYDAATRELSLTATDVLSTMGTEHGSTLIDYITGDYGVNGLVIEEGADLWATVNSVLDHYSPIIINDRYIDIYEEMTPDGMNVPYDLEFGNETTLVDVLKKVKDLYENRFMYMSDTFRFYMKLLPTVWWNFYNTGDYCETTGRLLSNLVLSEDVSIDKTQIYNMYYVYGKVNNTIETTIIEYGGSENHTSSNTETYTSGYTVTTVYTTINSNATSHKTTTTVKTVVEPCNVYILQDTNNPFSVQNIGTRKKVITDETCLTAEDCYNKGLWQCYYDLEFREKTTITLADNALMCLLDNDTSDCSGIGKKIEYTSIITGETNCYLLNKISHSFTEGTWTFEMQRFRPLYENELYYPITYPDGTPDDEKIPYDAEWGKWQIKTPIVTVNYEDNGKVIFTMSNDDYTQFSLFKVFIDNKFIGETCQEDENGNKVFEYTFAENGDYNIKISAYNPNFPPSEYWTDTISITNINNRVLINEDGSILTNEENITLTE